jgi:hypothetical protein
MSQNIGTLVTAAIRPNDSLDLIASAFANEIMGGLHSVTSSSDRNAIIEARREWGMLCYVVNDTKTYQLSYGYASTTITDNNNWVEFSGSGGSGGGEWLNSVLSILLTEPTGNTDGDRYLVGTDPGDTLVGTNWLAQGGPGFIAQWSSSLSNWNYTIPTDGASVRVDDRDNSIYRYEGTYPSGTWEREKESQVRYINAATVNGASYSATSSPYLDAYDTEALYIVKFGTTNTGASVSLSINSLPQKLVKKTDGVSLTDIISNEISTNYQYLVTYNGTNFELLNPSSSGGGSGLSNKYQIDSTETVTVPPNTQYWIYGDLGVDGTLNNYGQVVVVNGSLTNAGTFNNSGTYSNIYFAEINGLGQTNYVPRWVNPYMLTASSSIYDNGSQVTISSNTFSVTNNFVLPTGASNGYVLTSDSNGHGTWQHSGGKYSATFSFGANATQSITHNLNTSAIIFNFWNEDTGAPAVVNVSKTSLNTIDVMSTVTVLNGRVVIMS